MLISMAGEPAIYASASLAAAAYTFRFTNHLPYGHALAATAMALEFAVACRVIGARLEQRARTQVHLLTEVFLTLGGDPYDLFPRYRRTTRERVEARTPLLQSLFRDALEMVRETPCIWTRNVAAWTAIVLVGAAVERWLWWVALYGNPVNLLALAAIAPCAAAFAIVWNDLRRGRHRPLRTPRETRPWAQGYRPKPIPTVIPTVPVLLLIFLPAMSLGVIWTHGGSFGSHLNVTAAVLSMWALVWQHRNAVARSSAFRQMEQLTARLDEFIRRAAIPTWSLLVYIRRWCGWGSAAVCTVALGWPRSLGPSPSSTLINIAVGLLCVSALLTPLALDHWSRPVAPRTVPALQLLSEQGTTQAGRISTALNVCLGISLLLFVVVSVPA